jgi:hypothetical protein
MKRSTNMVAVCLTRELNDRVKEIAYREDRSVAAQVRKYVKDGLKVDEHIHGIKKDDGS